MAGDPGRRRRPRRPHGRARCASAPPGCAGRCGPGPAGMNVAVVRRATAGLAALAAPRGRARGAGRGRPRRPARLGGVRRGRRRGARRGRVRRARRCPARCPPRCSRSRSGELGAVAGRADHRVAQPARRQRLQGLPRRRRPARPAGGRRDRGGDRRRAARPSPSPTGARRAATVDVTRGLPGPGRPRSPRGTGAATCGSRSPRCTASAARPPCTRCARPASPTCTWCTTQAAPDADFPTVAFPNPEEPGATDLLLALAERVGADLAIALDPDADRCALGVPAAGGWRMLTGDETGVLLGDHLLRTLAGVHRPAGRDHRRLVVDAAASIAAAHGARFAETLTGFKWIVRARARAGVRLRGGARATASTRTPCATRTASPPPCSPATSPPR